MRRHWTAYTLSATSGLVGEDHAVEYEVQDFEAWTRMFLLHEFVLRQNKAEFILLV